ncbi:MAG: 2-hydroxy-acid oxidase [Rhodobacterales bacterium CG2_30_65_12]|nr:MAG: 2-hydroxy-acid oxidase [Rhodobacterales bacterium CG2_30_65_12]
MRVTSEADLAEVLAGASGPVRVRGGGTRDIGKPVTGEALEVGICGIELYEPGALTLVARAGTPMAEIEALLAGEGQRLAFEPMDHRPLLGTKGEPTIGGVVAANVSGPRRIQAGAARDFTLGARFVDGAGRVIKNGGRVMKNVTGYDLVKLMAGSWGTLGVLSEVSLKVQAVPETEATLVGRGLSLAEGVAALARALGSPYDVTGAAHSGADGGATMVRIEGLQGMVDPRTNALLDAEFAGWERVDGVASAALWRDVRDVMVFSGGDAPVWRVSLKPSDAPAFSAALEAAGLAHRGLYDWGGGLAWLELADAGEDAGAGVIRASLAPFGGHATLLRAPVAARESVDVFQPQPAPIAALSRGLKQKFDPRGILNPGLMGV